MCIAWIIHQKLLLTRRKSLALIIIGLFICLIAGITQVWLGFSSIVYPLWFGLAAFLIIPSLISLELQGLTSIGRSWLLLGDASYAVYLVHYPVLLLVFKTLKSHMSLLVIWPLAVAVATFAGIAFHVLIEKKISEHARFLVARKTKLQSSLLPA
jgi:peptidoglycan/LPS O-acetylase OafA/YrhL